MRPILYNWIVRPNAWAIPVIVMAALLGVEMTWQIIMLTVFASMVGDIVNELLPRKS